jgi:hypothetical protein
MLAPTIVALLVFAADPVRVEEDARGAAPLALPPPLAAPPMVVPMAPPVTATLPRGPTPGPWRDLSLVSVAVLGTQIVTLVVLTQFPATSTGWGDGSFDNIVKHDLQGPTWDGDPWYWNYVTHPISGSEYYLIARNRDVSWYWSLGYAAAMSAFWEGVTEAYYERPSGQDLLVTPLAGAFIGEVRFQAKRQLLARCDEAPSFWCTLGIVLLDPVDALTGGLRAGYR